MIWKNKKVLVTGSEGMIGKELVEQLEKLGTDVVGVDIKNFILTDITYKETVEEWLLDEEPDYIFHLAGIKGNPKMTNERPVDFMGPMLQFDTNMILAAQEYKVKRFLYTSSIAVENPETDKYPAWAKMTGETLIEAMRIQYPKGTKYCIVRPSNVYGRHDNFDNPNAMVITSLINKAMKNKKLILDKKGCKQTRDFINAKDVARGMIKTIEEMPCYWETDDQFPVNLCSDKGVTINQIALIIANELDASIKYKDLNLTLGPDKKIMKLNWDFKPEISLEEGIKEVIKYIK